MDTLHITQRDKVRSMRNKNMVENWDFGITSKTTRPQCTPLDITLPGLIIRANHIEEQRRIGNTHDALINYQKIAPHIPDRLSITTGLSGQHCLIGTLG